MAFTRTRHWVCAAQELCGRDASTATVLFWGTDDGCCMRQLGTTSGVLAGSALLRRASGKGSVSQIQLTGWRPEGHEARVDAWGEGGCGNAKPRHWCKITAARVGTTTTILHTASRIEAHEKTGADLGPMVRDQPSTSATGRFVVLQHSGARRPARDSALDLCSMSAAIDDAETTRAAAGQAEGRPYTVTVEVWGDGREAINHQAANVFSIPGTQEQLNHSRLMDQPSNAGIR